MKTAEIAARRGHDVTIIERWPTLGGQVTLAARQPEHRIIAGVTDHLEAMLRHLGVTVRLGVEATPELLAAERPDHVVLATGSEPNLPAANDLPDRRRWQLGRQVLPQIPGLDLPFVHSARRGPVRRRQDCQGSVLVIDNNGHWEGAGTAEYLADKGCSVEIVTSDLMVGGDIESGTRTLFYRRAAIKDISIRSGLSLKAIAPGCVTLRRSSAAPARKVSAAICSSPAAMSLDRGFRCRRRRHRPPLARGPLPSLQGLAAACGRGDRRVGDCVAPRLIESNIAEAYATRAERMSARAKNQLVRCLYQLTCEEAANSVILDRAIAGGHGLGRSKGRRVAPDGHGGVMGGEAPHCAQLIASLPQRGIAQPIPGRSGRDERGSATMHAEPASSEPRPVLVARGITKSFPGVLALDNVDFEVRAGRGHRAARRERRRQIDADQDDGRASIRRIAARSSVDGKLLHADPAEAHRIGVATIHQDAHLVPAMSVAENIMLGRWPTRYGLVSVDRQRQRALAALARVAPHLNPSTPAGRLSPADQQLVEIARAISEDSKVLVMDEPTTSLSPPEIDRLFAVVNDLKAKGLGIVFVSHWLEEVFRIADRVTVLRDGRLVGTRPIAELDHDKVIRMMVGREVRETVADTRPIGDVVLSVRNLNRENVLERHLLRGPRRRDRRHVRPGRRRPQRARRMRSSASTPMTAARSRSPACRSRPTIRPRPSRPASAWCPKTAAARRWSACSRVRTNITLSLLDRVEELGLPVDLAGRGNRRARDQGAGGQDADLEDARLDAVGRQPAEGGAGPLAGAQAEGADPRRADQGHRRRRQVGDQRTGAAAGARRHGHPADQLGAAGNPVAERPGAGDALAAGSPPRCRGQQATSETIMSFATTG